MDLDTFLDTLRFCWSLEYCTMEGQRRDHSVSSYVEPSGNSFIVKHTAPARRGYNFIYEVPAYWWHKKLPRVWLKPSTEREDRSGSTSSVVQL